MLAFASSPSQQLDLFIDGRDAMLVHEVVMALVAQDGDRVATDLAHLRLEHRAHPDLPALALLADALRVPPPSSATPATVTARIDEVERRLAPTARRFLGVQAATLLRPVWQMLAATAAGLSFDDVHPRAHPGWRCQQYGDWPAVRAAVEAEPDWEARPLLRWWMGLAQHHLGEPGRAIRLWLPLCWMDPAVFASQAPARALRTLLSLLPMERGGLGDELIGQRRALRDISPGFFRDYLEIVSRGRPGA